MNGDDDDARISWSGISSVVFVLLEMDGPRLFGCNDDLSSFMRELCRDFFDERRF